MNAKLANLKHCKPYGIPIIVIHHKIPESSQPRPLINPPNINHNMFPKNPILLPPLNFLRLPLAMIISLILKYKRSN